MLFDILNHSLELLLFGLVDYIGEIRPQERAIGWNNSNVKLVDLVKLFSFGICRPGHTGQFTVHAEIVLEGNRRQGLVFIFDLDPFLGFYRLMQAVRPAATRHEASGELINDHDFAVFHHIIHVNFVHHMGSQRLVHMVKNLDVARVIQVVNLEQLLYFQYALFCQGRALGLFVDCEVSGVLFTLTGKGIRLDFNDFTFFKLGNDAVDYIIFVRRIFGRARNDQRRPGFVDQDRVNLVNDGIIEPALNIVIQIKLHIVAKVIESEFIICSVGNVGRIVYPALLIFNTMDDDSHGQSQKSVQFAHPLRIAFCQIIIDCNDMDTFAGNGIEVGGQGGNQRFTLTGLHFGNLT